MLVDARRGFEPPNRCFAQAPASEPAATFFLRPTYQALLGRKNPLSSKSPAAI